MAELGDAELPEQPLMVLSDHVTPAACLYVKRTEQQRLAAVRQRRNYVEQQGRRKGGREWQSTGICKWE